jgi:hypothetical protein
MGALYKFNFLMRRADSQIFLKGGVTENDRLKSVLLWAR